MFFALTPLTWLGILSESFRAFKFFMDTTKTKPPVRRVARFATVISILAAVAVALTVDRLTLGQPPAVSALLTLLAAVTALINVYNAALHAASRHVQPAASPAPDLAAAAWPPLAVVIASCNEPADVACMTLASAVDAGYPGPLRIVVVDNSSDDTTPDYLAWSAAVAACPGAVFRRNFPSTAKKPGNLDVAMDLIGDAEFVLFLDVDSSVPHRGDTLAVAVAALQADPRLGFIQFSSRATNWCFSHVARAAALWQDLRNSRLATASTDGFPVFYGHNAVWRTATLRETGAWTQYQDNQLMVTEDLLMAVRARLLGWQGMYLPENFGEWVPNSLASMRTTWLRWNMGTQQVMSKLWLKVMGSPKLSAVEKADFFLHTYSYLVPLGIYAIFLALPFLRPSPVMPYLVALAVALWLLSDVLALATVTQLSHGPTRAKRLADLWSFLLIKIFLEAVCAEGFFHSFSGQLRSRWTPTAKGIDAVAGWRLAWRQYRAILGFGLALTVAALAGLAWRGFQAGTLVTLVFGLMHALPILLWHKEGRREANSVNIASINSECSVS